MAFIIKYIKACEFVATEQFAGSLDEATKRATTSLKTHEAEMAAVMDEADLAGAPLAVVTQPG